MSTINNGALRLYPAEGLKDELEALRLVQSTSTGAWSFDHHGPQGHDDRATALALMAVAALEQPSSQGWLDVWGKEIAGQTDYDKARQQYPELSGPTPTDHYEREPADATCRGEQPHRFQRFTAGLMCMQCGKWKV
mgnify:CR=1 FL=1